MDHVFSLPGVSSLLAAAKRRPSSRRHISEFVSEFGIDMSECVETSFASFADFFVRSLKPEARPIASDGVVAPVDGELTLLRRLQDDSSFRVKGVRFTLESLLGDQKTARSFCGGSVAIFYLSVQDYHRFHYPCDCDWLGWYRLGHRLFSVSPLSLEYGFRPFDVNVRNINLMRAKEGFEFLMIEVGAFYVGRLVETDLPGSGKRRGAEKGFFDLGGSTVVLVFPDGAVNWDSDLDNDLPVLVRMGERLATVAR